MLSPRGVHARIAFRPSPHSACSARLSLWIRSSSAWAWKIPPSPAAFSTSKVLMASVIGPPFLGALGISVETSDHYAEFLDKPSTKKDSGGAPSARQRDAEAGQHAFLPAGERAFFEPVDQVMEQPVPVDLRPKVREHAPETDGRPIH